MVATVGFALGIVCFFALRYASATGPLPVTDPGPASGAGVQPVLSGNGSGTAPGGVQYWNNSPLNPFGSVLSGDQALKNPTCADLGYLPSNGVFDFKIDNDPGAGSNGTYDVPAGGGVVSPIPNGTGLGYNEITLANNNGQFVDWASFPGIQVDAVIVKGGPSADVYVYHGAYAGLVSDTALHTPVNPNNLTYYGISHIDFCFHYKVEASKTVNTSFKRTWNWSILKSVDQSALTLAPGEPFVLNYSVILNAASVDSDWKATGVITIVNHAPFAAILSGVSDIVDGTFPGSVNCSVSFPYTLLPAGTLQCTYVVPLPDAGTRVNLATISVDTTSLVGGATASASVNFASAVVSELDKCVRVSDTNSAFASAFGNPVLCGGDPQNPLPKLYGYARTIVGGNCGLGTYLESNTASFVSVTNSAVFGSASTSVAVTVPACKLGCTLTQGYWKTHAGFGAPPFDPTWNLIVGSGGPGPNTVFFFSGKSYIGVMNTPPSGNAYYILAHQYIAAKLNQLKGASIPPAVLAAYNSATAFFSNPANTPAAIAALKGSNALRLSIVSLAGILEAYNSGTTGPGHCTE